MEKCAWCEGDVSIPGDSGLTAYKGAGFVEYICAICYPL